MPFNDQVTMASLKGDLHALQRWFPDDPTQWRSVGGYSLLHVAVQRSHPHVFDWLLTFPFDVNEPTVYKSTPLMFACFCGLDQQSIVRRLLDQGAHVHATDEKGWTALHHACAHDWVDGVVLLLDHEADPEAPTHRGDLPKNFVSVSSPHYATLCALLDAGRHECGLK
jgi:ankyrin repeat protein